MSINQSLPFTVTPQPGNSVNCFNGLIWPLIEPSSVRSLWLDASLELAAIQPIAGSGNSPVTIANFDTQIIFGDDSLVISEDTTIGNVFGFLVSGATASIYYAIRITATLSDAEVFLWDVALPVGSSITSIAPLPPGPTSLFGLEYDAWFSSLPTTLPVTGGQYWNNGGILSKS
jgi:hypothetical protein